MTYRGVVKGKLVVLEEGIMLPEGTQVEVTPIIGHFKGSPAALLEVWGSDVPDEAWEAVEKAIEEIDCVDREYEREKSYA
jgi:hypothetical protein